MDACTYVFDLSWGLSAGDLWWDEGVGFSVSVDYVYLLVGVYIRTYV